MTGRRAGQSHRPGAGHVNNRSCSNTCRHRPVIARGQNIRKACEVSDFLHRLRLVREFQQIEIRVGYHHVFRLPAYPSAHIDVAVSCAGAGGIDVQADACFALLTIAASSTGNIKRYGYQVSHLDKLHVASRLDHFAGDLVSETYSTGRGCTTSDHMLIAAANVGGNYLQNHAVLALAVSECELGKIDRLHLDFSRTHVNQSPIAGHKYSSFTIEMRSCWPFRAQHNRAAFGPL